MLELLWTLLGWKKYTIGTSTLWVRNERLDPECVRRLKDAMAYGELKHTTLTLEYWYE